MKIAILGWGSLIWELGEIPLNGSWQNGGPRLPIEFSRVSESRAGALTLVIDSVNGKDVPTLFAISRRIELADAICDLRNREKTVVKRIGFVNLVDGSQRCNVYPESSNVIRAWACCQTFDAVIWTDLPSNFKEKVYAQFSVDEAVRYLHSLPEDGAKEARIYIQKAPQEINTPLRRALKDDPWFKE